MDYFRCFRKRDGIAVPDSPQTKSRIAKPGCAIIENREKLNGGKLDDDHFLFQEICTGREFTVNCFYDRSGALAACVPHFRKLVRDGEVCFAQTERVPAFTAIAQKFSDIFEGLWGALCFQGFVGNSGSVKIFEINARFGGGYPICDQAGGTFARWILQDLSGQHPDYHDNWREGVRMLRYDAWCSSKCGAAMLFVLDLDDTLYLEWDYVRSGFLAVDRWLSHHLGLKCFFESACELFETRSAETFSTWCCNDTTLSMWTLCKRSYRFIAATFQISLCCRIQRNFFKHTARIHGTHYRRLPRVAVAEDSFTRSRKIFVKDHRH